MVIDIVPRILNVPTFPDSRGNLYALESDNPIPFSPKRIFFVTNTPENEIRGGHAHKECIQVIIPIKGVICISVKSQKNQGEYHLNTPSQALLIPPQHWVEYQMDSDESIMMVIASHEYHYEDYIFDIEQFFANQSTKSEPK